MSSERSLRGWKESEIQRKLSGQPQNYGGEDIGKISNAIIEGTVRRGRVVNPKRTPRPKKAAAPKSKAKRAPKHTATKAKAGVRKKK